MDCEFERGVVILSFDTEQIWGHLDQLTEWQYHRRYPDTPGAYDRLLSSLVEADIGATWFVVGGLMLDDCAGGDDPKFAGLPENWRRRLPAGSEATKPVWYRPSFVRRLAAAPAQEIGVHGGLTHLVWTDPRADPDTLRWELARGYEELEKIGLKPVSFSFPRDREAHHALLAGQGLRCYRGRTPSLSFQLGRSISGAALRALAQFRLSPPPLVTPEETLPGLWNIPSSDFLYPLGLWRSRAIPLLARAARFSRGIEAAARHRGIFHYCFHPANLAESPDGFVLLQELIDRLTRARQAGDIEILTVAQVVARLEPEPARAVKTIGAKM